MLNCRRSVSCGGCPNRLPPMPAMPTTVSFGLVFIKTAVIKPTSAATATAHNPSSTGPWPTTRNRPVSPSVASVSGPSALEAVVAPLKPEVKSHGPFKSIDNSMGVGTISSSKSCTWGTDRPITYGVPRVLRKLLLKNRQVLADPRSVAGFNRLWKEMVYPIHTTRSDGSKVWDVDGNEYVDL